MNVTVPEEPEVHMAGQKNHQRKEGYVDHRA